MDSIDHIALAREAYGAYESGDLRVGRVERSKVNGHGVSSVDTQAHGVRVDRSPVVDPPSMRQSRPADPSPRSAHALDAVDPKLGGGIDKKRVAEVAVRLAGSWRAAVRTRRRQGSRCDPGRP